MIAAARSVALELLPAAGLRAAALMTRPKSVLTARRLADGELGNRPRRRRLALVPRQRRADQADDEPGRHLPRGSPSSSSRLVIRLVVGRGFRRRCGARQRRRLRHRPRGPARSVVVGARLVGCASDPFGAGRPRARRASDRRQDLRIERGGGLRLAPLARDLRVLVFVFGVAGGAARLLHIGRRSSPRWRDWSRAAHEDNNRPECHQAEAGAAASTLPKDTRWRGRIAKGGSILAELVSGGKPPSSHAPATVDLGQRGCTAAGAVDCGVRFAATETGRRHAGDDVRLEQVAGGAPFLRPTATRSRGLPRPACAPAPRRSRARAGTARRVPPGSRRRRSRAASPMPLRGAGAIERQAVDHRPHDRQAAGERVFGVEHRLFVLLQILVVAARQPLHRRQQRHQMADGAARSCRARARADRGSSSAASCCCRC